MRDVHITKKRKSVKSGVFGIKKTVNNRRLSDLELLANSSFVCKLLEGLLVSLLQDDLLLAHAC